MPLKQTNKQTNIQAGKVAKTCHAYAAFSQKEKQDQGRCTFTPTFAIADGITTTPGFQDMLDDTLPADIELGVESVARDGNGFFM